MIAQPYVTRYILLTNIRTVYGSAGNLFCRVGTAEAVAFLLFILRMTKINSMVSRLSTARLDFAGLSLRKDFIELVRSSTVIKHDDFKLHLLDLIPVEAAPVN